jgi:hypothetical protein
MELQSIIPSEYMAGRSQLTAYLNIFLLQSILDPEDRGDMPHRNIKFSPNCTELQNQNTASFKFIVAVQMNKHNPTATEYLYH